MTDNAVEEIYRQFTLRQFTLRQFILGHFLADTSPSDSSLLILGNLIETLHPSFLNFVFNNKKCGK
jgi:hypothetical protein